MPKVSVIIPVYKAEKYINRCIDSVLAQTFTDWECILVDDGSPDRSGEICDEYAKKDARIRVLHKENGGVSSARNLGIEQAEGEWICFIDSDDSVAPDYLSSMYNDIYSDDTIVFMNYKPEYSIKECLYRKEAMVSYFTESQLPALSGPVCKLFNTKVIKENNISFDTEVHMGEDALFILNYLYYVDNMVIINNIDVYKVEKHEGSLSTRYYSFESEYKCFLSWQEYLERFLAKYGQYGEKELEKKLWEGRLTGQFLRVLQSLTRHTPKYSFGEALSYCLSLPKDYTDKFSKYYAPSKFRRKINSALIKYRLFHLFLAFNQVRPK